MTKLLNLFNQTFGHQVKNTDSLRVLHDIWDAWVEARIEYAKQYVIHNGCMD